MQTFITEDNHESKKAKGFDENVIDDELKYEDYKNVLFNRLYMRLEIKSIQNQDHITGLNKIDKFLWLLTMKAKIYT